MQVAKALLEAGADQDTANTAGETPLLAACERGHMSVVHALCRNVAVAEKTIVAGFSINLETETFMGELKAIVLVH